MKEGNLNSSLVRNTNFVRNIRFIIRKRPVVGEWETQRIFVFERIRSFYQLHLKSDCTEYSTKSGVYP